MGVTYETIATDNYYFLREPREQRQVFLTLTIEGRVYIISAPVTFHRAIAEIEVELRLGIFRDEDDQ